MYRAIMLALLVLASRVSVKGQSSPKGGDLRPDTCVHVTIGEIVHIHFQARQPNKLSDSVGYGSASFTPGPGIPSKYSLPVVGTARLLSGRSYTGVFTGVIPKSAQRGEYLLQSLNLDFVEASGVVTHAQVALTDPELLHSSSIGRLCIDASRNSAKQDRSLKVDGLSLEKQ